MKILVDADASPVLSIVEELAKKHGLELIIVKNYNHVISSDYGRVVTVDNMKEAADLYIMNNCLAKDIIVTQDYGLAAMVIGKGSLVINQFGKIIDQDNIDFLLDQRHVKSQVRRQEKAEFRQSSLQTKSRKTNFIPIIKRAYILIF